MSASRNAIALLAPYLLGAVALALAFLVREILGEQAFVIALILLAPLSIAAWFAVDSWADAEP